MTLTQIETNIKKLISSFDAATFIYDFLLAYDTPKSVIARLKKGQLNLSKNAEEIIWKKKLFYKAVSTEEVTSVLNNIFQNINIVKNKIRFIIVTNYKTIAAFDTKTNESKVFELTDLLDHVTFFLPLAGMETYTAPTENDADVKAAVQMAKLFDEIKKTNPTDTAEQVHNLNIFLSRLLFCFFAEDTDIFKKDLFTSSISSHTQLDGSDLASYLQKLFDVLNIEVRAPGTASYLKLFPYVNGGLFSQQIPLPIFTFKSRNAILESGAQQWGKINPDIFGSMIQAVVTPEKRGSLGMHYTSVPNIMKVIKPLFLDELYEEFESARNNPAALNKLLARISNIRIFDPACGSGNFLIIAYKELRYLEIQILLQLKGGQTNAPTGFEEKQQRLFAKPQLILTDNRPQSTQMVLFSRIELNHFFGIELDDFAHEVAKLSLWLAQHQMNVEFNKLMSTHNPSLPLRDAGKIVHGNATRLDWEIICPKPKVGEVFILGNPPYLGARNQSKGQKEDMSIVFEGKIEYKDSDYVLCWFLKGTRFIENSSSKLSFVTTSSISQGSQIAYFWPEIFRRGQEIDFAYQPFRWGNNAKDKAGVVCVIIGVQNVNLNLKRLYNLTTLRHVENITPYLTAGKTTIIPEAKKSLSNLPLMVMGNMARDGGNLILSESEKNDLCSKYPESFKFIRQFLGAEEFINGKLRFCLWLEDEDLILVNTIPEIKNRIQKVYEFRTASKAKTTNQYSKSSHKLAQRSHQKGSSIIIPRVSSERRVYIPFGFLNEKTIISDSAQAIYNAKPYLFAIISSRFHNLWVKSVGGYLGTSIRYSTSVCYNTFPFPPITLSQKDELEMHSHQILEQRAHHTEKTLAEMYDPEIMPEGLLAAHKNLDIAIEQCYRTKPFESDEERLAYLFKLYEEMIEAEKTTGTLFSAETNMKKVKRK